MIKAKKSLGQNFLKSSSILDRIISAANIEKNDIKISQSILDNTDIFSQSINASLTKISKTKLINNQNGISLHTVSLCTDNG